MSKLKYIKANVADRLPEKDGEYYTEQGLLSFSKGSFWQYEGRAFVKSNNGVDNWLEPVPDRDEEMREKANHIEVLLNEFHNDLAKSINDMRVYSPLSTDLLRIKELLNELKQ